MSMNAVDLGLEIIPNPLYVEHRAEDLDPIIADTDCIGRAALLKEKTPYFEPLSETYPDKICVICLDFLTEEVWDHDKTHQFHGPCIASWVKINPSCPTCRVVVDTTSLLGEQILLDDDGDADFEFPKEYENYAILTAAGILPFLVYDAIQNVNSNVIVPMILAGTGLFINKFAHPDFDNHGQSI